MIETLAIFQLRLVFKRIYSSKLDPRRFLRSGKQLRQLTTQETTLRKSIYLYIVRRQLRQYHIFTSYSIRECQGSSRCSFCRKAASYTYTRFLATQEFLETKQLMRWPKGPSVWLPLYIVKFHKGVTDSITDMQECHDHVKGLHAFCSNCLEMTQDGCWLDNTSHNLQALQPDGHQ